MATVFPAQERSRSEVWNSSEPDQAEADFCLHAQLIDRCRDFHRNFSKQAAAAPRFVVQSVIEPSRFVSEIFFDPLQSSYDAAAQKHGTIPNNLFELTETGFKRLCRISVNVGKG